MTDFSTRGVIRKLWHRSKEMFQNRRTSTSRHNKHDPANLEAMTSGSYTSRSADRPSDQATTKLPEKVGQTAETNDQDKSKWKPFQRMSKTQQQQQSAEYMT